MRKYVFQVLLCFLSFGAFTQTFQPTWQFTTGNTLGDQLLDIHTDASGNIYTVGYFRDSVDFDPGSGVLKLTTPNYHTNSDGYTQKLGPNGGLKWAKKFSSINDHAQSIHAVKTDDTNNVYVLGYFRQSIVLSPGGSTVNSNSKNNAFLVKLDSNGVVKWGVAWPQINSGNTVQFYDIELDGKGNIYLPGYCSGTVDIDPSPTTTLMKSAISEDALFLVLNYKGELKHSEMFGGTGQDWCRQIQVIDNDVYLAGSFTNIVDFDFGSGTYNLDADYNPDNFILKLDTAFNFKWAKSFGGITGTLVFEFKVNHSGSMYLGAWIYGTSDVNPDPNITQNITPITIGDQDLYFLKLDTAGNLNWARQYSGAGNKRMRDISVSQNEDIAITGFFNGTMDFDPNPNKTRSITSNGGYDAYVTVLDSSGQFKAVTTYGNATGDDEFYGLQYDSNGQLFAGGFFTNTIDLDPSNGSNLVTSNGDRDIILMRLKSCQLRDDTLKVTTCNIYTMPNGKVVYQVSGVYKDSTYIDTDGCDSSFYVDLTINPSHLTGSITQNMSGLYAPVGGNVQYQWLNCNTNQIVPGATSRSFMPPQNGSYAVIMNDSTCTDTTSCYSINNVLIIENALPQVTLFPNPTSGKLIVESLSHINQIYVLDLAGQLIYSFSNPTNEIDLSTLAGGVYFLQVKTERGVAVRRVVKR